MSLQYPRGGAQKNQTRRSQLVRKVYLCWERPGSPNGVQWLWSPRPSRCGNAMIPGSPFSSERSARHEARDLLGRLSNPHNRPPCEVDPSQPHCTDERVEALGQGRVMQVTTDSVHFPQIPPSTGLPSKETIFSSDIPRHILLVPTCTKHLSLNHMQSQLFCKEMPGSPSRLQIP